MLTPEETLWIGGFCGFLLGYVSGFLVSRYLVKGPPR
jgi:hypothetical protein